VGVKSWIEGMYMSKYAQATEKMERGKSRYRIVLRAGQ
jgi:D-arabinose 1-dehydrogenase-like Zn-dependent alcohol dehydrogenase